MAQGRVPTLTVGDILDSRNDSIKLGGVGRNREFVRQVANSALNFLTTIGGRAGVATGFAATGPQGLGLYYPYVQLIRRSTDYGLEVYNAAVRLFEVMLANRVIATADVLAGVRPIQWDRGSGAFIEIVDEQENLRDDFFYVNTRPELMPQSYSGADCEIMIVMGNRATKMKTFKHISIDAFRQKTRRRAMGSIGSSKSARGFRTVAGTIISTFGGENPIRAAMPGPLVSYDQSYRNGGMDPYQPSQGSDQIPGFDMYIVWTNEYGNASTSVLYNVEIDKYSMTISTENVETEYVYRYQASVWDEPTNVQMDRTGIIDPLNTASNEPAQLAGRRLIVQLEQELALSPTDSLAAYYEGLLEP